MQMPKAQFTKAICNPIIKNAIKTVLNKTSTCLAGRWQQYHSYHYGSTRFWDQATQKYVDAPVNPLTVKYTLTEAIEAVESDYRLRELVENTLGYGAYADQWFSSLYKSVISWNTEYNRTEREVHQLIDLCLDNLDNWGKSLTVVTPGSK